MSEKDLEKAETARDQTMPEDLPRMPEQGDALKNEDRKYEEYRQECIDGTCDHEGCCRSGTG